MTGEFTIKFIITEISIKYQQVHYHMILEKERQFDDIYEHKRVRSQKRMKNMNNILHVGRNKDDVEFGTDVDQ